VSYEALAHHGQTNSGTQPYVRYENGKAVQNDHASEKTHGEHD